MDGALAVASKRRPHSACSATERRAGGTTSWVASAPQSSRAPAPARGAGERRRRLRASCSDGSSRSSRRTRGSCRGEAVPCRRNRRRHRGARSQTPLHRAPANRRRDAQSGANPRGGRESRSGDPTAMSRSRGGRRCRIRCCCDRPSPVSFVELAHARREAVDAMDSEVWWWFECWSCGYVCTCEV